MALGELKRKRTQLSKEFITVYEADVLENYQYPKIIEEIGKASNVVAFFCVESLPEACHRSIVAKKISSKLGIPLEHICP